MWRLRVQWRSGNCRKEKPFKSGFFLFIKKSKKLFVQELSHYCLSSFRSLSKSYISSLKKLNVQLSAIYIGSENIIPTIPNNVPPAVTANIVHNALTLFVLP